MRHAKHAGIQTNVYSRVFPFKISNEIFYSITLQHCSFSDMDMHFDRMKALDWVWGKNVLVFSSGVLAENQFRSTFDKAHASFVAVAMSVTAYFALYFSFSFGSLASVPRPDSGRTLRQAVA